MQNLENMFLFKISSKIKILTRFVFQMLIIIQGYAANANPIFPSKLDPNDMPNVLIDDQGARFNTNPLIFSEEKI